MSRPSRVTHSRGSRVRVCSRGGAHYRIGIMFPERTFHGSGTVPPICQVLLDHCFGPSQDHVVRSPHISDSLTQLRMDPVVLLEAESDSYFGVSCHTLLDIILERYWLCYNLNETKINLSDLQRDVLTFQIQTFMFIEHIVTLQNELRAVKAERDGFKTVFEQQAGAPSSNRERCKGSSTVSDVRLCYFGVATRVLSKLPVCCAKKHQSSLLSQTLRNVCGLHVATLLQT